MVVVGLIIALLPAFLCALILAGIQAWRPDSEKRLIWAVPTAVGVGFVAAQSMVDGAPRIPPIEASGWFSIVAALAVLLAIAVRPRVSRTVWSVLSTLAMLAMVVVISYPLIGNSWTVPVAAAWILGMTAVAGTVAWLVDTRSSPGPGAPVVFLIAATGVAVGLAMSGSARYGQLAGAIASVMGPLTLIGLLRRDVKIVLGGAWASYLILAMLIVAGVVYVDVPVFVGLLIAVAPLGMLAGELPKLRDAAWWKRDGARAVVTGAIVAAAIGVALASATDSGGY